MNQDGNSGCKDLAQRAPSALDSQDVTYVYLHGHSDDIHCFGPPQLAPPSRGKRALARWIRGRGLSMHLGATNKNSCIIGSRDCYSEKSASAVGVDQIHHVFLRYYYRHAADTPTTGRTGCHLIAHAEERGEYNQQSATARCYSQEIADQLIQLNARQRRPIVLIGHSQGANIAHGVLLNLQARGLFGANECVDNVRIASVVEISPPSRGISRYFARPLLYLGQAATAERERAKRPAKSLKSVFYRCVSHISPVATDTFVGGEGYEVLPDANPDGQFVITGGEFAGERGSFGYLIRKLADATCYSLASDSSASRPLWLSFAPFGDMITPGGQVKLPEFASQSFVRLATLPGLLAHHGILGRYKLASLIRAAT